MALFPIFLSVVIAVRNESENVFQMLVEASKTTAPVVADYKLITVDNASNDASISVLQKLTRTAILKEWIKLVISLGNASGAIGFQGSRAAFVRKYIADQN